MIRGPEVTVGAFTRWRTEDRVHPRGAIFVYIVLVRPSDSPAAAEARPQP